MAIRFNDSYLRTNRGVIKIIQIILGIVICSLLCAGGVDGKTCFGEGRVGYASGLNFVCLIINIERIYSAICTVLFLVAAGLLIWVWLDYGAHGRFIAATIITCIHFLLFLWDIQILQGDASNF